MNGSLSAPAKFREASVLVDAWGAERAAAGTDRDLAAFEVAQKLLPFLVSRLSQFDRCGGCDS